MTNHFLHFLALDRSDPKKFQILQLIAALLGWTDGMWCYFWFPLLGDESWQSASEQREQAGLARPGTSSTSNKLRVPSTPIHRTPSTPTLATEFLDNGNSNKESLAELWSNFLEQESQATQEYTQPKPWKPCLIYIRCCSHILCQGLVSIVLRELYDKQDLIGSCTSNYLFMTGLIAVVSCLWCLP